MKSRLALWMFRTALKWEPAIVVAHTNQVQQARADGFQAGLLQGQRMLLQHQAHAYAQALRN